MTTSELGAPGEFLGSVLTLVTLVYLATQIRQHTAQQRREELVSIQHGQNSVLAHMLDPRVFGGYVRGAAGRDPSIGDRATAQFWVIQYLNHFQIVHDLYRTGALDEETHRLWAGSAVAVVAPSRIREWWDHEDGRLAFHPGVREMIDRRLNDTENPPRPITEMWTTFSPAAWESEPLGRKSQPRIAPRRSTKPLQPSGMVLLRSNPRRRTAFRSESTSGVLR